MKREEILGAIKTLASSQGCYSRLYRDLMELQAEDITKFNEVMEELESKNFKDVVDLVMYIEC